MEALQSSDELPSLTNGLCQIYLYFVVHNRDHLLSRLTHLHVMPVLHLIISFDSLYMFITIITFPVQVPTSPPSQRQPFPIPRQRRPPHRPVHFDLLLLGELTSIQGKNITDTTVLPAHQHNFPIPAHLHQVIVHLVELDPVRVVILTAVGGLIDVNVPRMVPYIEVLTIWGEAQGVHVLGGLVEAV